jgi:hypothetical protein
VEVEIDLSYSISVWISHTAMKNINDDEWWRTMNEMRCLRDDFSVAEPTDPTRIVFNALQKRK